MELSHLHEFVALARIGNFTETAKALHITQSTLSKHIAALEREFGCDLLIRSREGSVLTVQGELLRTRAADILAAIDKTRTEMAALATAPGNTSVDTRTRPNPRLRKACLAAVERCGLSPAQAGALALYLEGIPLEEVALQLDMTRDDASILIAGAYQALEVTSKERAQAVLDSYLE